MENIEELQSLGFSFPSPAYIVGAVLFSLIGFVAYRYGKKREHPATRWLGLALMLYPYVVPNTMLMYGVGIGLCGALYYYRQ